MTNYTNEELKYIPDEIKSEEKLENMTNEINQINVSPVNLKELPIN